MIRTKDNNKKGFTLIELMIVVAILGIVVVGLTSVFKTFLDSWWLSRTKLTTQEDAREAAYWIVKEFKGARRTTLGSIVINSGFERGAGTDDAYLWNISYNGATEPTEKRMSSSAVTDTATVRTGDYSMEFTNFKTTGFTNEFRSDDFEVTFATRYLLSGWFRVEGATVSLFEVEGTDVECTNITTTNGQWVNFSSTGTGPISGTNNILIEYTSNTSTDTIYVDDISLTPLSWVMVDNTGSKIPQCSTYYYTTQEGAGGNTEGELHSIVIEERTIDGNTINRIVRKRLDISWAALDYSNIKDGTNWDVIGFNTLAENVSYMSFKMGSDTKESPLNINMKFTGTPSGGSPQEFEVRTQVYPLTE